MKTRSPERLARRLAGAVLMLAALPAFGEDGGFQVRSASSTLSNGVYYVDARIDYQLSRDALEALQSGLSLTVELQFELARVRRLWPDETIAELRQSYRLSYQPLSESYVLRNLNTAQQTNHRTLFAALAAMGQISGLPLIDAALLDESSTYEAALRAILNWEALPGPLRFLFFWSDGLRLESDWYRWTLRA